MTTSTTSPIDSTLEFFHQQLIDLFSDDDGNLNDGADDAISNTLEAALCFKDAFDLLSLQLKAQSDTIASLELQLSSMATSTPSAPSLDFPVPSLESLIKITKSKSNGINYRGNHAFTSAFHAANGSMPPAGLWERVDQKPWIALASQMVSYRTQIADGVLPPVALASSISSVLTPTTKLSGATSVRKGKGLPSKLVWDNQPEHIKIMCQNNFDAIKAQRAARAIRA